MAEPHASTFATAEFQLAMSNPRLSEKQKAALAEAFYIASQESEEPRWCTNPGPQAAAYVSAADELYFGGSAGPGKTALMVGLALTAHTKSLILRLEGTHLSEVKEQLTSQLRPGDRWKNIGHGGEFRTYDHRLIELLGCDDDKRASTLQGRPHDLKCVARGTLILMGDGSYKAIERIRPSDMVSTLQGPRRVTRTIRKGFRNCVKISLPWADTTVSADHHFLTPSGWADARAVLTSTLSHVASSTDGSCVLSHQVYLRPCESIPTDLPQASSLSEQILRQNHRQGAFSWSEDRGISCEESYGQHQMRLPPALSSFLVVLHEPAVPLMGSCWQSGSRQNALGRVCGSTLWTNSRNDCPSEPDFRDVLFHPTSAGDRAYIPSQVGAADSDHFFLPMGDRGRIPSHTHLKLRYRHPYTKAWEDSSALARVHEAQIFQADAQEVFDITVEQSAHYVSYGGIIHKNCWDELPQFNEKVFRFVNGWNRSTIPNQRCRVVGAGNPPLKAEEEWVLKYWGPWLDDQHPLFPHPPGELCWFTTIDGKDEQVADGSPIRTFYRNKEEWITPVSRTFIPALLKDNPDLDKTNYRSKLAGMPEPLRSQLLYGDMQVGRLDHEWQLIPTSWVMRSMKKDWKSDGHKGRRITCGALDCAQEGVDNAVLAKRYVNWIAPLTMWPGKEIKSGEDIARRVAMQLESMLMPMLIDVSATPGGSAVQAFKILFPKMAVWPINFGAGSTFKDRSGQLQMANIRAEAYFRVREALDPSMGPAETRLQLPDDPLLAAELCSVRWSLTGGRVQLEKKDDIKKRIGRSPDRADAVAMSMLSDRPPDGGWLPSPSAKQPPVMRNPSDFKYGRGGFMGSGSN